MVGQYNSYLEDVLEQRDEGKKKGVPVRGRALPILLLVGNS